MFWVESLIYLWTFFFFFSAAVWNPVSPIQVDPDVKIMDGGKGEAGSVSDVNFDHSL